MDLVNASTLVPGDVVSRVVQDPGAPGEHIFSGQIVRVRRFVPGFVTIDTVRGAMTLSDAATVEVDGEEDAEVADPCPDCGEGPVAVLIGGAHCPVGCGWVERW